MSEDLSSSISQKIGELIHASRIGNRVKPAERLEQLKRAERLIFETDEASMLDNFLDEMLEFLNDEDEPIRLYTIMFVVSAVEKDAEIMKKVVNTLSWFLQYDSKQSVPIQKETIVACTRLYALVLAWANQRKNDRDAEKCWKTFAVLKQRILSLIESSNEGLRIMCIKFMETMIICQSAKSEFSEAPVGGREQINLLDIHRDHRTLSVRQLEAETQHGFVALIDRLSSTEIASQTLLTIVQVVCNIARQRPSYMLQVVSALESLQVNLPPTLATCQVKSLRKELRYELLHMLRHPVNFSHQSRLTSLLTDLGCPQSEQDRNKPTPAEVSAALRKRAALASAAAVAASPAGRERAALGAGVTRSGAHLGDERDAKRIRLDDDEYVDEGTAEILRGAEANNAEDIASASQRAIDITADFVYERLTLNVAVKLVTISLFTLPDTMPAAFQSSFTNVNEAGTEAQRKNLSRMMAIQLTKEGEGPGIKYIREEKQKQYLSRQYARLEGAVIAPTPAHEALALSDGRSADAERKADEDDSFSKPKAPTTVKRNRIVQWDLLKITKELLVPEAEKLAVMAFRRVLNSEQRALQGGAIHAQQQLLVRLVSRYHTRTNETLRELLIEYIVADQKSRADLALLWLREVHAQLEGNTKFVTTKGPIESDKNLIRYNNILCGMLSLLVNRNEIKEILFHRILLETPLVTSEALDWLRKACLDPTFGGFSMSTLRELILNKELQRRELLDLFLLFSYHEPLLGANNERLATTYDVRESCVDTAKELFEVETVRGELRERIIEMSEQLTQPSAPLALVAACQRLTDEETSELAEKDEHVPWDEQLIRSALYLFMAVLPVDQTLLTQLARVTAAATNEVKRVIFRTVERAVKAIGMQSPALLDMIENCPVGAEPLVARIVHLLTERTMATALVDAPTPELVDKVRTLHKARNTDVRSLLPILSGIPSDDLRALVPKFVMNATNSKSVPLFFRKLMFSRHVATHAPLMTAVELLHELHHCVTSSAREQSHLVQHIDQLIIDADGVYSLSKEVIARAIEELLQEEPLPKLLYHTLQRIYDNVPPLKGFLVNVLHKALQTHEGDDKLKELHAVLTDKPNKEN